MNRSDWEELEAILMKHVVKRRALGGYSAEAEGVLILFETMLRMVQHFRERAPRPKRDSDD